MEVGRGGEARGRSADLASRAVTTRRAIGGSVLAALALGIGLRTAQYLGRVDLWLLDGRASISGHEHGPERSRFSIIFANAFSASCSISQAPSRENPAHSRNLGTTPARYSSPRDGPAQA